MKTIVIITSFTLQKVYIKRDGSTPYIVEDKVRNFIFSDETRLFAEDGDTTKATYEYVPVNGQRTLSLKAGYDCRYIVKHNTEEIEFETVEDEDLYEDLDEDFLW